MDCEFFREIKIRTFNEEAAEEAKRRLDHIAKPLDGLGAFENLLCRIAGIQGSPDIDISRRIVVMMCSDNGIVDEGVTQSSYDVTAKVASSMSLGRSSVCLMAERAGADTLPVDVGIKERAELEEYADITPGERGHYRLLDRCVGEGTADFVKEPAMTREDFRRAFDAGRKLAGDLFSMGYSLICTGEMGIGNTTTSAALAAGLLHLKAEEVTGRGAGLDDEGLNRKIRVIDQAISGYGLYEAEDLYAACAVGGYDISALAGLFTGGAEHGIPVVADGLISAVSALLACRLCPGVRDFILPSHMGEEKAMQAIMRELGLEPLIYAGMKLGEGTGAVMMLPLLDMALSVYRGSASFDEISVEQYSRCLN